METIFERLRKKAMHNVSEDYVTEALRGVLLSLSLDELNHFLSNLLKQDISLSEPDISTQYVSETERYDILISDAKYHIIFENKWDSESYIEQLLRYDKRLSEEEKASKILVHLTKDHEPIEDIFENTFIKIAWSDVYKHLKQFTDIYLISEFLTFLKHESITMDRVTWQLIEGGKAINALQHLVARASEENGYKIRWGGGSSGNTEIKIGDSLYAWFFYDKSELIFGVYGPLAGKGVFQKGDRAGKNWSGLRFDFDEHNYFHRSYEEQLQKMKDYIKGLIEIIEES